MAFLRLTVMTALLAIAAGCASAQTAIERRFIPDAELEYPRFARADDQSQTVIDNGVFNAFLKQYLVESADGVNRVRYSAVTDADRAALNAYIDKLEAMDPVSLSSDEQLAYWINLYNAVTIEVILETYPVESIRDIKSGPFDFKGPWNDKRITVAGETLSLDEVEHSIIRAVYNEPRIHYAVNCASIGCPNLRPIPYNGATIETALTEQAGQYINHPRGVSVDDRGRVTASKIFTWYAEDFGENEAEILDHIRLYAAPVLLEALAGADNIRRYDYDWALNDER